MAQKSNMDVLRGIPIVVVCVCVSLITPLQPIAKGCTETVLPTTAPKQGGGQGVGVAKHHLIDSLGRTQQVS